MVEESSLLPPIKAKVGDIVEIPVRSNPTTGFVCTLSKMPEFLYLARMDYVPDHPGLPGSGGTEFFKFAAVDKGNGEVEFRDVKFSHPLEIKPPNVMQKRFVIIE